MPFHRYFFLLLCLLCLYCCAPPQEPALAFQSGEYGPDSLCWQLFEHDRFAESLERIDSLLGELPEEAGRREALLLQLRGRNLEKMGQIPPALQALRQSRQVWETLPDTRPVEKGLASYFLASVMRFVHADSVLAHCDTALLWLNKEAEKPRAAIARVYSLMGFILSFKSDFSRSAGFLQLALQLQESLPAPRPVDLGEIYQNQGSLYHALGDYPRMIACMEKAIRQYRQVLEPGSLRLAHQHNNLAIAWMNSGKPDEAVGQFQKALRSYQAIFPPHHPLIATVLTNIGCAFLIANRYPEAFDYLTRALEMRRASGNASQASMAKNLYNIGESLILLQREKEAAPYFEESWRLLSPIPGIPYWKAEFYLARGRWFASQAMYRQAETDLLAGLDTLQFIHNGKLVNLEIAGRAQIGLAMLNELGQVRLMRYRREQAPELLQEASATYQLALQLVDSLRFSFRRDASLQILSEHGVQSGEGFLRCLMESGMHRPAGREAEVLQVLERSKDVLLRKTLRQNRQLTNFGLPAKLADQEQFLRLEIAYYNEQLLTERAKGENGDTTVKTRLQERLFQIQRSIDSLDLMISKNYPHYDRFRVQDKLVDLSSLQQYLSQEKAAMLEFFLGDSILAVLAVAPDTSMVYLSPKPPGLEASIDTLRQLLYSFRSSDTPDRFIRQARSLYRQLLKPVLEKLPDYPLILIPDGYLAYLPFHLLLPGAPKPGSDPWDLPYLLHQRQIRYEFSASVLANPPFGERPAGSRYLGFAPAYPDDEPSRLPFAVNRGSLSPLRYNQAEVKAAARIWPGRRFLNQAAREKTFRRLAGRAAIIHLAMHALTSDNEPLFSWLAFSPASKVSRVDDGRMHAFELYNLRLNASLAVLSGCNTGAGRIHRGEGVMSLARAFRYAGCRNVVMSLWPVNDAASGEIIPDFFRELKKGRGKAEALRQAQLHFLKNPVNADYRHPYFWAAYVLVGDNTPLAGVGRYGR